MLFLLTNRLAQICLFAAGLVSSGLCEGPLPGSAADTLNAVANKSPAVFSIAGLSVTEPGSDAPLDNIEPGKWYAVNVTMQALSTPWDSLASLVVSVRNDGFAGAVTENLGGLFSSAENYVFQVQRQHKGAGPGSFLVGEKRSENSPVFSRLFPDPQGLYSDGAEGHYAVDTLRGRIGFLFKLMHSAKTGEWRVSAFAVNRTDRVVSNIWSVPLTLGIGLVSTPKSRLLTVVLAALLAVCVLVVRHLRNRKKIVLLTDEYKEAYQRIQRDLEANLAEVNTVEIVRSRIHMGRRLFQNALLAHGYDSLLSVLNNVRIDRAKSLLRETGKRIPDIAREVGYMDANYFRRVFEKAAGVAPEAYREDRLAVPINAPHSSPEK